MTFSKAKGPAKGDGMVPDTPIRALGRLLWAMEKQGDVLVSAQDHELGWEADRSPS